MKPQATYWHHRLTPWMETPKIDALHPDTADFDYPEKLREAKEFLGSRLRTNTDCTHVYTNSKNEVIKL